mmetsp:Transcript_2549/g.6111  ORF Transcript_2549/g.6111 Transcript_2549/m.6111 type:complete len:88 (-) Transcript_2549:1187-1450(-)
MPEFLTEFLTDVAEIEKTPNWVSEADKLRESVRYANFPDTPSNSVLNKLPISTSPLQADNPAAKIASYNMDAPFAGVFKKKASSKTV